MVANFAENFWDADFNATTGYDVLISRLKEGKKMCDAYSDFIRNRAKLEEDYGRNLIKLATSAGTNDETGTLKSSWDSIKRELENIGSAHCDYSKRLMDELDKVDKFRDKQKMDRRKADERMRRLQRDKKTAFENMIKAKKSYEAKCKESDQSKDTYDAKAVSNPKDEDKMKLRMGKAKTAAEVADSAYSSCVKILEDCRRKWESEMEMAAHQFQALEVERVQFLRNEMWIYANLGSTLAVVVDERYEESRQVLERCDEDIDIQLFIHSYQTGSTRPAPILYENYYQGVMGEPSPSPSSSGKSSSDRSLPTVGNSNYYSGPAPFRQMNLIDDPTYASPDELRGFISHGGRLLPRLMRVAFNYDAQSEKELTMRAGDIIEVQEVESDLWAIGLLNGRRGAFPLEFTEQA